MLPIGIDVYEALPKQTIKMTRSENFKNTITGELTSLLNAQAFSFTSIFDKIYGCRYADYTDNDTDFKQFIISQSDVYFGLALEEYKKVLQPTLKQEIQDIALRDTDRRYDVLIKLRDRDCFEIVLKNAEDFLKGDDYLNDHGYRYEDGQVLFDLIEAYYDPIFQEGVVSFFHQAFNFAKNYAKENKKWDYLSGDPEGTTLLVIAQAVSSLSKEDREQFADLVFEIYAFCSNADASYDVNQASGYIALLLTTYDKRIDIEILNNAVEVTGEHYQNNTFVHQTLYCKWLLTNDSKSALSYLTSEENVKGYAFAIMSLADLNCKEALPVFESLLEQEKDPVFIELLKEAIERLNIQKAIPEIEKRMIWMNGNLTPTQRALGAESNNVFVKRAQEKIVLDNNVYETDDE